MTVQKVDHAVWVIDREQDGAEAPCSGGHFRDGDARNGQPTSCPRQVHLLIRPEAYASHPET